MTRRTPQEAGLVPHDDVCGRSVLGCPGWHREWMTPDGLVAVGMNDDGTVDEVLHGGSVRLHLEQMDETYYWMNVGDMIFYIGYAPRRRCQMTLGEWEGEPSGHEARSSDMMGP